MTPDTRPANATDEEPCRRCATCKRSQSEEVRFGSDHYHCLSCIAARIREWRRRKRAEASGEPQAEAPAPQALTEPDPQTVVVPVVRASQISLAIEGYLAESGSSWLAVAAEAKVDRGQVHRILMAATPTVERPVADALLRAIGADPASVPDLAVAR